MTEFTLRKLLNEIPRYSFRCADEKQLHAGLASVLVSAGISFVQEESATPTERFDFLCAGGVVIEAKIKGSFAAAIRQVDRYCKLDEVKAVVLITTREWGKVPRLRKDAALHGKPVRVVHVGGQSF